MKSIVGLVIVNALLIAAFILYPDLNESLPIGNSSSEAPEIELLGDEYMSVTLGDDFLDPGIYAIDPEEGVISSKATLSTTVDTNTPGRYEITYTVTDRAGNSVNVTRIVYVIDPLSSENYDPIIFLNDSSSYSTAYGETFEDPGVYAYDPEDGYIYTYTYDASSATVDTNALGDYNVVYQITDSDGASVTTTRTVTVKDLTGPVITFTNSDITTIYTGESYLPEEFTVTDNIDEDETLEVYLNTSELLNNIPGTYNVYYISIDSAGNRTEVAKVVQVLQSPIFTTTVSSVTHNTVTLTQTLADISNLVSNYEIRYSVFTTNGLLYKSGKYTYSYSSQNYVISGLNENTYYYMTFSFDFGDSNEKTTTSDVFKTDITPNIFAEIDLIGDSIQNLYLGDYYIEQGATATDIIDGDLTSSIVIENKIDIMKTGTYEVIYSVTNSLNNTTEVVRIVNIRSIPSLSSTIDKTTSHSVDITLDITDQYSLVDYSNVLYQVVLAADDSLFATGVYDMSTYPTFTIEGLDEDTDYYIINSITYNGIVLSYQSDTFTTILYSEATITLKGDTDLTLYEGDLYFEYYATAYDSLDGNITNDIIIDDSSVDMSTPGTYYVYYTVENTSGYVATVVRTVYVLTAPTINYTISNITNTSVTIMLDFIDPDSVIDIYDIDFIVYDKDSNLVAYELYDYSDYPYVYITGLTPETIYDIEIYIAHSNNKTIKLDIQDIETDEDIYAVLSLRGSSVIDLYPGDTYTEPGATSYDDIDGNITGAIIINSSEVDITTAGTYFVYYSVTNSYGNTTTRTRTVNVLARPDVSIEIDDYNFKTVDFTIDITDIDNLVNYSSILYFIYDSGNAVIDTGYLDYNNYPSYTLSGLDGDTTYYIVIRLYHSDNRIINFTSDTFTTESNPIPELTLLGDEPLDVYVGDLWVDPGYEAVDIIDGDITSSVVISYGIFDMTIPGTYTIRYDVTNSNGFSTKVLRTVNVLAAPTATISYKDVTNDDVTVVFNITDEDNVVDYENIVYEVYLQNGTLHETDTISYAFLPNLFIDGLEEVTTYYIKIIITHSGGKTLSYQTNEFTTTNEVYTLISLNGEEVVTLYAGDTYTELYATADDDNDGNVTADVTTDKSAVDTSIPGEYLVVYSRTNTMDNTSYAYRIIVVLPIPELEITLSDSTDESLTLELDITDKYNVVDYDNIQYELYDEYDALLDTGTLDYSNYPLYLFTTLEENTGYYLKVTLDYDTTRSVTITSYTFKTLAHPTLNLSITNTSTDSVSFTLGLLDNDKVVDYNNIVYTIYNELDEVIYTDILVYVQYGTYTIEGLDSASIYYIEITLEHNNGKTVVDTSDTFLTSELPYADITLDTIYTESIEYELQIDDVDNIVDYNNIVYNIFDSNDNLIYTGLVNFSNGPIFTISNLVNATTYYIEIIITYEDYVVSSLSDEFTTLSFPTLSLSIDQVYTDSVLFSLDLIDDDLVVNYTNITYKVFDINDDFIDVGVLNYSNYPDFSAINLESGITYYLVVYVNHSDGKTLEVTSKVFTTATIPTLTISITDVDTDSVDFMINIKDDDGVVDNTAIGYEIYEINDLDTPIDSGYFLFLLGPNYNISSLLDNTTYIIIVGVVYDGDKTLMETSNMFTTAKLPSVTISMGEVFVDQFDINLDIIDDSNVVDTSNIEYTVYNTSDVIITSGVLDYSNYPVFTITGLSETTTYYLEVTIYYSSTGSDTDTTSTFTTATLPTMSVTLGEKFGSSFALNITYTDTDDIIDYEYGIMYDVYEENGTEPYTSGAFAFEDGPGYAVTGLNFLTKYYIVVTISYSRGSEISFTSNVFQTNPKD